MQSQLFNRKERRNKKAFQWKVNRLLSNRYLYGEVQVIRIEHVYLDGDKQGWGHRGVPLW